MLAVLLVAPFLGLDNFAVSVVLGLQGLSRKRCGVVVALFGTMAALAIMLGDAVGSAWSQTLGSFAQQAGGLLLVGLGLYELWQERRATTSPEAIVESLASLALISVAVSLDTIVAGIAFGLRGDPIVLSAMIVGTATALLTFSGLAFGAYMSKWRRMHGRMAPVVMVGLGVAIAAGVI